MKRGERHLIDDIERMQSEVDRLLHDAMTMPGRWFSMRQSKAWRPPTDVYETDSYTVIKVEVAGMEEGDFTISLSNRTLTISGVRPDPTAKLAYQQMEIAYGYFETEIYLPWPIADDEIEATYKDGFLKVIVPKAKTRKIPIVAR